MSEENKRDNEVFQQTKQQQLNSLSQELGFEVPVESVGLPSKGLIYPMGHPLSNETMVDIKAGWR